LAIDSLETQQFKTDKQSAGHTGEETRENSNEPGFPRSRE